MTTFNVRDPEIEQLLREVGGRIKGDMPPGWGFALLMFSYGPGGGMFYIASAEREDILRAMREFIERNTH